MLNILQKIYDKVKEIYGPRHFSALLILLVVFSFAGLAIGLRYSSYIKNAPEYCNNCHTMKESFAGWRNSDHKTVTCQQCHQLGVIEQNMLLVKYIIYGPEKVPQKHGKKLPWENCGGCHWEQKAQGGDHPEESYGHYRHNFIQCFNCHPYQDHNFPPDTEACRRCHKEKTVHGAGMEGLTCVSCHIFSLREGTEKNRIIPTRHRCMKCHENALKDSFPETAPMGRLECFECHKPHGDIKPNDALCVACHGKDLKNNGHLAHKATPCGKCHKAHLWKAEDTGKLCSSCHSGRSPEAFLNK